ncbi:MAG: hypothetical protein AAB214_13135, partial [Fibrobacterota bacterium]
SPEQTHHFDDEELDLLTAYHTRCVRRDDQQILPIDGDEYLKYSEILIEMIGAFSERVFCAGWKSGIEFDLWDLIHSGTQEDDYMTISQAQRMHFKLLSQLSRGWIYYGGDAKKWVPLKEWLFLFAEWKRRKR